MRAEAALHTMHHCAPRSTLAAVVVTRLLLLDVRTGNPLASSAQQSNQLLTGAGRRDNGIYDAFSGSGADAPGALRGSSP